MKNKIIIAMICGILLVNSALTCYYITQFYNLKDDQYLCNCHHYQDRFIPILVLDRYTFTQIPSNEYRILEQNYYGVIWLYVDGKANYNSYFIEFLPEDRILYLTRKADTMNYSITPQNMTFHPVLNVEYSNISGWVPIYDPFIGENGYFTRYILVKFTLNTTSNLSYIAFQHPDAVEFCWDHYVAFQLTCPIVGETTFTMSFNGWNTIYTIDSISISFLDSAYVGWK